MRFLLDLAWRDLRSGGAPLRVFAACLMLGVALVAAGGGLYRQVAGSLQGEVHAMFGGDVEVRDNRPLEAATLAWMGERGALSRMVQMRTMLRSADGRSQLVELQGVDSAYPLYGEVRLKPAGPLSETLRQRDGTWGIALDAVLARRIGVKAGDRVEVGDASLEVRAIVEHQPDRSLRAEWYGAPVLVAEGALAASGLIQPGSRVDYRYRVRIAQPAAVWRSAFRAAFPNADARVRTIDDRSDRVAEILDRIGSGLMLVGFSALFIGGLGVANSVRAWLDGKLGTLATLRALGLRDARLAALVLLQVVMLSLAASAAGAALGALLAWGGLQLAADRVPLSATYSAWLAPLGVAIAFGVLTALTFALPALGRALGVSPAALFRGLDGNVLATPRIAWALAAAVGAVVVALLMLVLPEPRFGVAFLGVTAALLVLLEGVLLALRAVANRALLHPRWQPSFELRVALAALQRPGSPLRASLLSLGTALTLLVACTLVVATLLRTVNETVPQRAPSLLFYDVQTSQLAAFDEVLRSAPTLERVQTAPLVIGRLAAVNGEVLKDSSDERRRNEARDEHKLSYRAGNVDDVIVTRGAWWPEDYRGPPRMAMEDREADALSLVIGDRLRFEIMGKPVEVELAAIYAQRRMQSRLWLEGIFSDGVLDPFVTRYVGAAYLEGEDAIVVQDRLAAVAPNVVTVRTQAMLDAVRGMMARASAGLAVIAGACLAASLLVLASVVAANRARQTYEASVMHALGARVSSLRRILRWEHALMALVTAGFAIAVGSALAFALLEHRLELDSSGLYWTGALAALAVAFASSWAGARVLLAQLRIAPARLLRAGA